MSKLKIHYTVLMTQILYIALGGSVGASARYLIVRLVEKLVSGNYPLGVLLVNIVGSFLISYLFFIYEEHILSNNIKSMLSIGFFSAFTTFSTYSLETFVMFKSGLYAMGLLNIALHNGLCILFCLLGFYCASLTNTMLSK